MELWAGELGACKCESLVGTEIGLKRNTKESSGLALRAGESTLARMDPCLWFCPGYPCSLCFG